MTKDDLFALFLRYIDEATNNGQPADVAQYADYRDKFNYYLDSAVKYLAKFRPVRAALRVDANAPSLDASTPGIYSVMLPIAVSCVRTVENACGKLFWRLRGSDTLLIGADSGLPVTVYYDKLPDAVAPDAPDEAGCERDEEVQPLVALRCAILATQGDNSVTADNLQNQFNQMATAILNSAPTYANTVGTVMTMG